MARLHVGPNSENLKLPTEPGSALTPLVRLPSLLHREPVRSQGKTRTSSRAPASAALRPSPGAGFAAACGFRRPNASSPPNALVASGRFIVPPKRRLTTPSITKQRRRMSSVSGFVYPLEVPDMGMGQQRQSLVLLLFCLFALAVVFLRFSIFQNQPSQRKATPLSTKSICFDPCGRVECFQTDSVGVCRIHNAWYCYL